MDVEDVHTIKEIAEATCLSMSVAFKRLKELGHELDRRAGLPVVKKARKPRTPRVTPELDSQVPMPQLIRILMSPLVKKLALAMLLIVVEHVGHQRPKR